MVALRFKYAQRAAIVIPNPAIAMAVATPHTQEGIVSGVVVAGVVDVVVVVVVFMSAGLNIGPNELVLNPCEFKVVVVEG